MLLLLGDSVYMDFCFGDRRLGWPRKAPNQEFAGALYSRYKRQWEVASFRRLMAKRPQLGMTWDDHDFAWNGSRGAGTEKKKAVPTDKRAISRALFLQFRKSLADNVATYPAQPALSSMTVSTETGIQQSFDREGVRFVMLDGRSFREDPNPMPDAEMHGRPQREWLAQLLETSTGLNIVGSGSVMTSSGESWDQYLDYGWLLQQTNRKIIVLTGDVHHNVPPIRHSKSVYEITSSGAARPPCQVLIFHVAGGSGNFGLINTTPELSVTLYSTEMPGGSNYPLKF